MIGIMYFSATEKKCHFVESLYYKIMKTYILNDTIK